VNLNGDKQTSWMGACNNTTVIGDAKS
jgi:hypothetical protein